MAEKKNIDYTRLWSEFIAGVTITELSKKYSVSYSSIHRAFNIQRLVGKSEKDFVCPCCEERKKVEIEAGKRLFKELNLQRRVNSKKAQVYNGIVFTPSKRGYFVNRTHENGWLMHRYVWITERGPIPKGYHIHHINGDMADNRIENLECLTPKEHGSRHKGRKHIRRKLSKRSCIKKSANNQLRLEPDIDIPEKYRWNNSSQLTNQG